MTTWHHDFRSRPSLIAPALPNAGPCECAEPLALHPEVGDFRHRPAKSRKPPVCRPRALLRIARFPDVPDETSGAGLALVLASIDMFRAALVSMVLALTLGQNVVLLCRTWCHPEHGAHATCEHQVPATSPSATASESCTQLSNGTAPFVREDGPRRVSASDGQQGIVAAQFQFVLPPTLSAYDHERAQRTPLEVRPLVLALRI